MQMAGLESWLCVRGGLWWLGKDVVWALLAPVTSLWPSMGPSGAIGPFGLWVCHT